MRSRRASRLVAVTAVIVLAGSGAGACLYPRTAAAAKECCRTRCNHDGSGTVRSCCCKDPAPQTTGEAASEGRPLAFAPLAVGVVAPSAAAVPPAVTVVPHLTTGPPGFLQRRTLLL